MDSSKVNFKSKKPKHGKLLPCVFLNDVLCSFRKSKKFTMLYQCRTCPHLERFEREMDEEDERIMDEIDRERAELDGVRRSRE